jgi:hypothetical protein
MSALLREIWEWIVARLRRLLGLCPKDCLMCALDQAAKSPVPPRLLSYHPSSGLLDGEE